MKGLCESNIIFSSVCPSVHPSRYLLLNHWTEFNKSCYISSPRDRGARRIFSFHFSPLSSESVGVCEGVLSIVRSGLISPQTNRMFALQLTFIYFRFLSYITAAGVKFKRSSALHKSADYILISGSLDPLWLL